MADNSDRHNAAHAIVLRVLDALGSVRPSERRDAVGAFLTLFGFMAGHALLETARDALFLAELPAALLPWVYLTIAALALVLIRYHSNVTSRLRQRHALSAWLVLSGGVTLTFWIGVSWAGDWIFYALYVWSGLLSTLIVVQFWTLLSNRFTVTQAKRLFAVVGSGSVLGAILGSGLARILTEVLPAQHLVLVAGVVLLLSSSAPLMLESGETVPRRTRQLSQRVDVKRVADLVWGRPYLRRIAITILFSTITFTLVDFIFKSTVARLVADADLGAFFSTVYLILNMVSLLVQVVAVGWILRHVALSTAVAIVPALLLLGALGFIAAAGMLTVLLLKGADGSLRYSLHRTTTELLFVPMSSEVRGRVKAFIDVLGQRGGQALGSLLVLLILTLTADEAVVAVFAAVAAAAWLYMALDLRRHYLDVFRETLSEDITATRIEFPALDLASLETLLATLNSRDDRKVVAALGLLAAQGKVRVVPGLILYHPSPAVVTTALELFAESRREDVIPLIDRLLSDKSPDVRSASLRARTTLQADEAILRRALRDRSPEVEATALVGLVASGRMPLREAHPKLAAAITANDTATMLAMARAIRGKPTPEFEGLLLALSEARDNDVQLETIHAMRSIKNPAFTSALMSMLAHRALRDEARAALVAMGPTALARIGVSLVDMNVDHAVRRHLPRTIAAFGTPQASSILQRHLLDEPDGMIRFKILRALGSLRTSNPLLPLDRQALQVAIDDNVSAAFRFMRWRRALIHGAAAMSERRTECHAALVGLLRDKESHALERLFRLQNLYANDEEFLRIYRGLHSARGETRAGGRELIEHLVEPPLRQKMLRLVDDLDDAAQDTAEGPKKTLRYELVIDELLRSRVESLSSLAAYHVGELRLTELAKTLTELVAVSGDHAAVLADAREALGTAQTVAVAHE
jgi:AAA family ATP:ADP antiporter